MSTKWFENKTKSDSNCAPTFFDHHLLLDMTFNVHCLITNNISIPKTLINPYITYTLGPQWRNVNTDFTVTDCHRIFSKLTKNADLDKYKYTSYSTGFDSCLDILFTDGSYGKNVINFGVDMSSSVHVNNKGRHILIAG